MSSACNRKPSALRRLLGDSRGASALEFSLVLLPMIYLMVGAMELGRYYFTVQSVRTLVAEAARMAMLDNTLKSANAVPAGTGTDCSPSYAVTASERNAVNVKTPFLVGSALQVCINNAPATGNVTILVKVSYPFNFSLPLPFISGSRTITDQTTLQYRRV